MIPTIDRKATGVRLRQLMDEKGFDVKLLREYLGLASVQSIYHWLNGISIPTVDNLYALSQLFEVPIDDMICGSRDALSFKEVAVNAEYTVFCSEKKSAVQENGIFTYAA